MKVLAGLVTFAIFTGLAVLLMTAASNAGNFAAYEGKEVFTNEQDYGAFKVAIASSEVDIKDMTVLHSDPPIIVVYTVRIPIDSTFAYGDRNEDTHSANAMVGVVLGSMVIIFGFIACMSIIKI